MECALTQHHGAERPLQHFYRNEIVCNGQIFLVENLGISSPAYSRVAFSPSTVLVTHYIAVTLMSLLAAVMPIQSGVPDWSTRRHGRNVNNVESYVFLLVDPNKKRMSGILEF